MRNNFANKIPIVCFVLLGLVGALVIFYCTSWGPIVYSDSTEYILSARSWLAGKGLGIPGPGGAFQLLTLHPPLYPLVLGVLGVLGVEPLEGARWLNVLLCGLVIFLASAAVYHFSRRFLLSFLIGLVILTSSMFLEIFSSALSEPLFFLLFLICLFLLVEYLGSPRYWLLVGAGVAAGLASLASYRGFALTLSGALIILAFQRNPWKKRLIDLVLFGGISAGLAATWLLPLYLNTQSFAARSFQLGDDLSSALREARVSLIDLGWSWIPFSQLIEPRPSYFTRGWSMILLFVILAGLTLFVAWRRYRKAGERTQGIGMLRLAGVFGLFSGMYLVFVTFSFFFSSPRNDLNGRLFSPVYLSVLIMVFSLLTWALEGGKLGRLFVWLAVLGLVLLVVGGIDKGIEFARTNHREGAGYTSAAWTGSPTIRAVKELDQGLAVISNESAAILFLTGRSAYDVNVLFSAAPSELNARYGDDPDDPAQRLFQADQAALVIFPTSFYWQLFPIYGDGTQDKLDSLLGDLRVEQTLADGVIYRYLQP